MKKVTLVAMAATALLLVGMASCKKDESNTSETQQLTQEGVTFKDGALHFASSEVYFSTTSKLGVMSPDEREKWGEQMGFTSLAMDLNDVYSAVAAAESEEEVADIVSRNADIVKRNEEGLLVPLIQFSAYASVANRSGVFYVNGVVHKVEGEKIAMADDGSIATATAALRGSASSLTKSVGGQNGGVQVFEYVPKTPITTRAATATPDCGTSRTAFRQLSDRKVTFEMKTFVEHCNECCGQFKERVIVESRMVNYKKNIWGNWKEYSSASHFRNRTFTVNAPENVNNTYVSSSYDENDVTVSPADESSSGDWVTYTTWTQVGQTVNNTYLPTPQFSMVKGRANSRGLGYDYAEIICN